MFGQLSSGRRWIRSRHFWQDLARDVPHLRPGQEKAAKIVEIIDSQSFNWRVFSVAASGFLASSYSLFATNVVKPAWYYDYPPCGRLGSDAGLAIDEITLVGTAFGMFFAGHLADLWGRKKLYGMELGVLIMATLGVVMASEGFLVRNQDETFTHSMDFYQWVGWWRFVLGVGIGAEYPLSAIIAAEWSPTKSRGKMLAGVYAMQAVARLLAPAVSIAALRIASSKDGLNSDTSNEELSRLVVDKVWRWATGIILIPAAFAVILRLTIPETARYHSDIQGDIPTAIRNALKLYPQKPPSGTDVAVRETREEDNNNNAARGNSHPRWYREWIRGAWHYLNNTRARRDLITISLLWLMMDLSWYGLSMESGSALSTLWHDPSAPSLTSDGPADIAITIWSRAPQSSCIDDNSWRTDPDPNITISQVLEQNAVRSMLVVSIGSILGNIALVFIIDRFRRKNILIATFLVLSVLFAVTGASLLTSFNAKQPHGVATIFFGIIHFFFTIGPKTVILVLAVEMFPTVYRGTFYGTAAAIGKIGAIVIRGVVGATGNGEVALARRLLGFIALMLVAAATCLLLPDVQRPPVSRSTQLEAGSSDSAPSDTNSVSETNSVAEPGQANEQAPTIWRSLFQRLENKTLEEIAPTLDDTSTSEKA